MTVLNAFTNAQFDREFLRLAGSNLPMVKSYKDKHGIKVLPKPSAGNQPDMCIVYKPLRSLDGILKGYRPVEMNSQPAALLGAIAKGFLLAPLEQQNESSTESAKVETVVESLPDNPVEQSSSDTEHYVCERKFANGKTCGREYKTEGRYLQHVRNKHS
jgi:hypothetical protein|tara:strand:+ start:3534 stop:4010 length:477 start_codon:yes stop_codon:yes gene_type:complete